MEISDSITTKRFARAFPVQEHLKLQLDRVHQQSRFRTSIEVFRQSTMEYLPLNSDLNEIRLLTFLPGDSQSEICCTLQHASLINPPTYVALSYCWGNPAVTKPIVVNDVSIQVTTNLESALRHLRIKGYSCLWIDAVCIHQEDLTEKNEQLSLMSSIYRRASSVAAWIGEDEHDSSEALDFLVGIHESQLQIDLVKAEISESGDKERRWTGRGAGGYDSSGSSLYSSDSSTSRPTTPLKVSKKTKRQSPASLLTNHSLRHAFTNLLARPYWTRVWVIQELALSKFTTFHCGQRSFSWTQLLDILSTTSSFNPKWRRNQLHPGFGWIDEDKTPTYTHPALINAQNLARFQQDASANRPISLLNALIRTMNSESTNPLDKVFALTSLTCDSAAYIPLPNYRQSLKEACVAITLFVIATKSSLDPVALLAPGPNNSPGLPSWAPNWFALDDTYSRQLQYL